ncbi:tyrosine-type recombinase/integrase [Methanotrichaceae archaeon M04Ac]|jgi:integrase/recombinase XerD|uniref:Tyrosine-type recombinase/integrase n=1 Tax=Candidatus Methanocrinis alkalitolerans TaxID=3033395 RepID=A0ABT5XC13_9EURY|nr:tyrosine-type recombinase/integrase [Candidatus Methanocrinis alkalitolerans]MDF0592202.1 tyrosine-type recombinase/integrase [Candidatus Methanocrinis alkalitolerans]
MAMDRLIEGFLQDCAIRGMTKRSVESYHSSLKNFAIYVAEQAISIVEVDKNALRGYIEHLRLYKGFTMRTIEANFSAISSFYEYLVFEGIVSANPVIPIRKRYIKRYKNNDDARTRKLISADEMAMLINSTIDIRDKAIITLLAKTGIRRNELITLDLYDVDFVEQKIRLKPTAKRKNRTIFFDEETAFLLRRWLKIRIGMNLKDDPALFLNAYGGRLNRNGIYDAVVKAAERVGLHDPKSDRLEDHFTPHCCRHWFTTHLRRAGMPREFIQELRGDARRETIDIYDHIDEKELRESYLAHIPQLGI